MLWLRMTYSSRVCAVVVTGEFEYEMNDKTHVGVAEFIRLIYYGLLCLSI